MESGRKLCERHGDPDGRAAADRAAHDAVQCPLGRRGIAALRGLPVDQFGNQYAPELALARSATGGGHVTADGTFVADGAQGAWLVKASAGEVEGVAAARVLSAVPRLIGAPSVVFEPGFTAAQVTVQAEDDSGAAGLRYAWRPLSGASEMTFGSPEANATRIAFAVPGDYRVAVDITDGDGQTVSVPVTVGLVPAPAAIAVEPAHAELATGTEAFFTARILDQLGRPLYVPPAEAPEQWSVNGGGTPRSRGLHR